MIVTFLLCVYLGSEKDFNPQFLFQRCTVKFSTKPNSINTFFQFPVTVLRKGRSDAIHKIATSHDFRDDNYVSNLAMHMFLYVKINTFMMGEVTMKYF